MTIKSNLHYSLVPLLRRSKTRFATTTERVDHVDMFRLADIAVAVFGLAENRQWSMKCRRIRDSI